jgi:hypothetical protein
LVRVQRQRAAADVDGFYTARQPGPSPDTDLLVLSGKGIVMRPGALREATVRPSAQAGRGRRPARLGFIYPSPD